MRFDYKKSNEDAIKSAGEYLSKNNDSDLKELLDLVEQREDLKKDAKLILCTYTALRDMGQWRNDTIEFIDAAIKGNENNLYNLAGLFSQNDPVLGFEWGRKYIDVLYKMSAENPVFSYESKDKTDEQKKRGEIYVFSCGKAELCEDGDFFDSDDGNSEMALKFEDVRAEAFRDYLNPNDFNYDWSSNKLGEYIQIGFVPTFIGKPLDDFGHSSIIVFPVKIHVFRFGKELIEVDFNNAIYGNACVRWNSKEEYYYLEGIIFKKDDLAFTAYNEPNNAQFVCAKTSAIGVLKKAYGIDVQIKKGWRTLLNIENVNKNYFIVHCVGLSEHLLLNDRDMTFSNENPMTVRIEMAETHIENTDWNVLKPHSIVLRDNNKVLLAWDVIDSVLKEEKDIKKIENDNQPTKEDERVVDTSNSNAIQVKSVDDFYEKVYSNYNSQEITWSFDGSIGDANDMTMLKDTLLYFAKTREYDKQSKIIISDALKGSLQACRTLANYFYDNNYYEGYVGWSVYGIKKQCAEYQNKKLYMCSENTELDWVKLLDKIQFFNGGLSDFADKYTDFLNERNQNTTWLSERYRWVRAEVLYNLQNTIENQELCHESLGGYVVGREPIYVSPDEERIVFPVVLHTPFLGLMHEPTDINNGVFGKMYVFRVLDSFCVERITYDYQGKTYIVYDSISSFLNNEKQEKLFKFIEERYHCDYKKTRFCGSLTIDNENEIEIVFKHTYKEEKMTNREKLYTAKGEFKRIRGEEKMIKVSIYDYETGKVVNSYELDEYRNASLKKENIMKNVSILKDTIGSILKN